MATMTAITTVEEPGAIARPLRVLIPLIQQDLKDAHDAAESAAMPYYRAAGDKLLEAKTQLPHGEFVAWVKRHFNVQIRQAQTYMQLADAEKRVHNAFRV